MAKNELGLIGLGLLGGALAERLVSGGYRLLCYDIDPGGCRKAAALGAAIAPDPAALARACPRLLLSLPSSGVVRIVIEQLDAELSPGQIIFDTTTGDPQETAALAARLASRKVEYVDAAISGSSEQARRRDVTIMAGGETATIEACRDLFDCLASRWFHVGPPGSGQMMKLVTNLVMGLNRAALAEGLAFAEALGLDGTTVLEVLMASVAYSRIMETKGTKMLRRDFTPQARLSQHLKDVRLMIGAAARAGMELPLTETHRRLLAGLEAAGFGDADNSAVIRAFTDR